MLAILRREAATAVAVAPRSLAKTTCAASGWRYLATQPPPKSTTKKVTRPEKSTQAQEQTPPPLSAQRAEAQVDPATQPADTSAPRKPTPGGSLFDIDTSAQLIEVPAEESGSGGKTGAKARRSPSSSERKRQDTARIMGSVVIVGLGYALYSYGKPWQNDMERERFGSQPGADGFSGRIKLRMGAVYEDLNKPVFEQLLPDPLPFPYGRPYTMVVDLDDLLVHSEWSREYGWRTAKRPGLDYFLGYLSQFYEIVLFTTQPMYTAAPIIEKLDPDRRFITYTLFRESCRTVDGKLVKDLNYLNRDLSKVVVLDTSADSFALHPENGILIPPWKGDKADRELVGLIPWFEAVGIYNIEDVRKTIAAYSGTHIPTEHAQRTNALRERELAENKARAERMGMFGKVFSGVSRSGQAGLPADKTMYELERDRYVQAYADETKYWNENGAALRAQAKEDQERQIREMKLNTWGWVVGGLTGGLQQQPPTTDGVDPPPQSQSPSPTA